MHRPSSLHLRWAVVGLVLLPACASAGPGLAGLGLLVLTALAVACGSSAATSALGDAGPTPTDASPSPTDAGEPLDGGPGDLSVPDLGEGTWEPCCRDGVISTCFCPVHVACNYGWFIDCGDGTCVNPTEMCES